MNYHLFQLICRFKLVLRLITLERAAKRREEMEEGGGRETETDRWQQPERVNAGIMM